MPCLEHACSLAREKEAWRGRRAWLVRAKLTYKVARLETALVGGSAARQASSFLARLAGSGRPAACTASLRISRPSSLGLLGTDLTYQLRTCSVTRALSPSLPLCVSLLPPRASAFQLSTLCLRAWGPWIWRVTAITPRDEPTFFCIFVTMYQNVPSKASCPASKARQTALRLPVGMLGRLHLGSSAHSSPLYISYTFPIPRTHSMLFFKTDPYPCSVSEPSSCPSILSTLAFHTCQLSQHQRSGLPRAPFIYPAPFQPHAPFACLPTFV